MTHIKKSTRNDRNRQAAAGVQKHITQATVLDGKSFTPAELEKVLTDPIQKADATTAAEAAFHQAVNDEKASVTLADAAFEALRKVVLNQFKGQPTVLSDFGVAEPVRKPRTAAKKAEAVAKAEATRKAHKAVPAPAPTPAATVTPPKA